MENMLECINTQPLFVQHSLNSPYINGLTPERRNSIANALELRLSCIDLSIYFQIALILYFVLPYSITTDVSLSHFPTGAKNDTENGTKYILF